MGEALTGGAFALLGIKPQLGRAIQPEDDVARGGHPVVMLSHGYWQRAFGGDPQVVGRTLQIGRRSYTIVGVAPADYRGGLPAITPAFYVPMAMQDELMGIEMLDPRRATWTQLNRIMDKLQMPRSPREWVRPLRAA